MEKNKIVLGKRYNRLIPIEKINKKDKRGWNEIWYRCKCDCGNEKIIRGNKIASGHTHSCGCYQKEQTSKSTKKINGLSTSKIYGVYKTMISRCYNKNSTKYYAYGARGINVCEEWKNDFLKFYDWAMKNGYEESLTIDRIDVNGDYCIENCRWIKMEEQASNKRNTIKIKYKNYNKTIKEWSNLVHIKPNTIKFRFKRGWDIEDVLFKPLPHSPWRRYLNGNCITSINIENGTKIHETINEDDINFEFEFSESCDVNLTNRCDGCCAWCLVAGTKILMGDYSYKNIEDVKIGDTIIGYEENSLGNGKQRKIIKSKVTKTFIHVESELYNVETRSGLKITTTPNHPFLAEGRGKNHSRKYSKIQDIEIGKYLFSIQLPYLKEIDYSSKDYKLGYMIGAWAGDGTRCSSTTKEGRSKFLCRFVTKDKEINEMVMSCTSEFIDGFYWNDFNMHGFIIPAVTNASKDVFNKLNKLFDDSIGNINTREYAAGFVAGMYDTEGSIGVERCNIRITNTNLVYLDEVQRCLSILEIENIREVKKDIEKYSRGYKPIYNIRIKGKYQWNNFLWLTRPCCPRKNLDNNISQYMAYGKDELVRKDKICDMQYVYNLETECHTYIANNILVHNCYQGCTPKSNHADILSLDFLDTIHPYTELAINGNDLSHPDLIPFLKRMKKKEVIVSMTVNQKHFMKNIDFIKYLLDNKLIKGLGISLVYPDKEFINEVKNFPTAVIHTIAGIITKNELDKLANNDLKILILGYKTMKNRGKDYYENGHKEEIDEKIEWLSNNLGSYLNKFKVVSFDNLCTKQLNVKNIIGEERWKECYMGDDGTHTFYIDLVKKKFARTSISEKQYDLLDNIDDMFKVIKNENKSENKE